MKALRLFSLAAVAVSILSGCQTPDERALSVEGIRLEKAMTRIEEEKAFHAKLKAMRNNAVAKGVPVAIAFPASK